MVHIAYVMTVYKDPEQVVRLVDRLNDTDVSFLIHVDKKTSEEITTRLHRALDPLPNCRFVKQELVYWCGFGVVRAILNAIDHLFEASIDFDVLIHMSGQCYPIKANREIKQQLAQVRGKQLMEHFPLPCSKWEYGGLNRFQAYYLWVKGRYIGFPPRSEDGGWRHAVRSLSDRLGLKRRVPCGYSPYGGSFVWAMSREAVTYIHEFTETQAGRTLIRFYRHTYAAAETFFQTMILNSHLRDTVINSEPWLIDWEADSAHPGIFTVEDYPRLRDSDKLFARKFDLVRDSEILDMIDAGLLQVPTEANSMLTTVQINSEVA